MKRLKSALLPRGLIAVLFLAATVSGTRTIASHGPDGPGTAGRCGSLASPRAVHTATRLPDGGVLIAGGMERNGVFLDTAEVFDPATGRFRPAGPLSTRRVGHTATALADGRVLIAGGTAGRRREAGGWLAEAVATAEIYDPGSRRFLPAGSMAAPRTGHAAVRLRTGEVLLAGGSEGEAPVSTAEIYDPAAMRFRPVGGMAVGRVSSTALLLPDGTVFLAGGSARGGRVLGEIEIFDPAKGTFRTGGALATPRHKHAAAVLPDGRVLVAGGSDERDWRGQLQDAEICDPRRSMCRGTAPLGFPRFKHGAAAVTLPDGRVIFAGGAATAETYDPARGRFFPFASRFPEPRYFATATALRDGRVLVAGGYGAGRPDTGPVATAEAWVLSP